MVQNNEKSAYIVICFKINFLGLGLRGLKKALEEKCI